MYYVNLLKIENLCIYVSVANGWMSECVLELDVSEMAIEMHATR